MSKCKVWTHSRHLAALGYWETSFHSRLCHCFASLGMRQIALRSKWHLSTAQYRDLWAEKRPAVWCSAKNLISCRSATKGIQCGEQRVKAKLMSGMRRKCCLFGLSLPPFAKCSQSHLTLQNITAIVAPWGGLVKTQDTAYMLYIMIMKSLWMKWMSASAQGVQYAWTWNCISFCDVTVAHALTSHDSNCFVTGPCRNNASFSRSFSAALLGFVLRACEELEWHSQRCTAHSFVSSWALLNFSTANPIFSLCISATNHLQPTEMITTTKEHWKQDIFKTLTRRVRTNPVKVQCGVPVVGMLTQQQSKQY